LAPAILQLLMPSPARAKAVERHGKEPLNTQSLRSHHNVQAPKMAMELNPFLRGMYTQRRSATPPVPKADFLQAAELRCPTQIALGGETRTVGRREEMVDCFIFLVAQETTYG
jgi:hypothetical protein